MSDKAREDTLVYNDVGLATRKLVNANLYETCIALLSLVYPEYVFEPNWKRLGKKSKEEGRQHVLKFLKANEKSIANRGYGHAKILNGNLNTILELKGDKIKSKKDFIQV